MVLLLGVCDSEGPLEERQRIFFFRSVDGWIDLLTVSIDLWMDGYGSILSDRTVSSCTVAMSVAKRRMDQFLLLLASIFVFP